MNAPTCTLYPGWENLLDTAIRAALIVGPTTDALEATMLDLAPAMTRPQVFDPAWMRQWLDVDETTACHVMRIARGNIRWPENRAEAEEMLGPGCRERGRRHWIKVPQAYLEVGTSGIWEITACCDCGHPFLRYAVLPSGRALHWSIYPDLL